MESEEFVEKYGRDVRKSERNFERITSILSRHDETLKRLREEVDDVKNDMEEQDGAEQPPAEPEDKDKTISTLKAKVKRLKAQLADGTNTKTEQDEDEDTKTEQDEDKPEKPKVERSKGKGLIKGKEAKNIRNVLSDENAFKEALGKHFE